MHEIPITLLLKIAPRRDLDYIEDLVDNMITDGILKKGERLAYGDYLFENVDGFAEEIHVSAMEQQ